MANEKLITQIQELINSNNQKAITGDSLANLLIDIVTELSENSYPIYELKVPDDLNFTDEDKANNLMIRERIYNGERPMIVWYGLQCQLNIVADESGNITDHNISVFFLDTREEPEYLIVDNIVVLAVYFHIEEDGTVTIME